MSRVSELIELREAYISDPNNFIKTKARYYWNIVGELKRESYSNNEEVKIASDIRDMMYEKRLGKTKPIFPWMIFLNIIGIGFLLIASLFFIEEIMLPLLLISWALISAFMLIYNHLVPLQRKLRLTYFIIIVGSTIIIDIFLLSFGLIDLLTLFNQLFVIAAVPCFYLNGRWLGGKIANIGFDGISRDVFWLYTLKINYQSYLLAKPTQRQWIFFCGGLGTVGISLIGSTLILILYGNSWFFLFPILLFVAEILDYMNLGGPLGGGEFNHLRREHRIIKEWKNSIQEQL